MKGFIIDLDGTIYKGNQLIEGAKLFIETLQKRNIPYLFVTNNSLLTPKEIAEKIERMGVIVKEEEIFTSSLATVAYLKKDKNKKTISIIGGNGLYKAFEEAGFEITEDAPPDVVVQGVDPSFTYQKLTKCIYNIQQGADYILTNPDMLIPTENGFLPGAGSIAASIQAATQRSPVIIGKPSPIIMQYAIEKLGMEAKSICVVGDNLLTDIQAGSIIGCQTAWVMTGIAPQQRDKNVLKHQNFRPDVICQSLVELLEKVEERVGTMGQGEITEKYI